MENSNKRKSYIGKITSNKMDKTVVVTVSTRIRHKKYGKVIWMSKKFYAHAADGEYKIGDNVKIIETRPISKLKRWRIASEPVDQNKSLEG